MPDISDAPKRKLPFPLYDAASVQSTVPVEHEGTFIEFNWQTEDTSERVLITLELSLDEYVALASSIDVGMDIAYSDDAFLIWYIWNRAYRGAPVMTCEQIIDCIENDAATQAALSQFLTGAGNVNPNSVDADNTTVPMRFAGNAQDLEDEIGTLEDCNLDVLWGAIRHGIVLYLDDNARNFLEDLNTQADKGQRAASLLEAIPVVGDLAASVTLQFVELVPDLLNLFNAYSSETVLDEIACAIFEMVCAECRFPTWDELFSYYASAGISGIDDVQNLVLTAATDYLLGSSQLAALACYHTIVTYELFVLYLGAKFNGAQGTSSIALWGGLGEDFSSDNWIDLCDGCEPEGFEPVISLSPCPVAGQSCGTIVGLQSPGVWRIASTHRAEGNDESLTLADAQGRLFRITAMTAVSGSILSYSRANNACVTSSGFGLGIGTDIKNIIWSQGNTGIWTYDITVVLV